MTTAAKPNFGAELWLCPAGGSLVKIAELTSVSPPNLSRGVIDATSHDSTAGAMEFIAEGIYDPGEITATWNHIGNSTADAALTTAITTGAKQDFKIVDKAASGSELLTGSCFVTSYQIGELGLTGLQTASCSMKITGAPVSA